MGKEKITIVQHDKYRTIVEPYYTANPKGSILVLHGMAEHHERYDEFARFLNKAGFDVFLYDHRGHGMDKKFDDLGHFADKNGYRLVISDAITVLKHIKKENRGEKLILFGHSMGSLIARNVIQKYDEMDACIICGTAHVPTIASKFGSLYAWFVYQLHGPLSREQSLADLITGGKNYTKICTRTAFDWLTRDNTIVGAYINDPFCGFLCTTAFYRDMLKFTYYAAQAKSIKRTRRDLPILIISGSHDPVGNYGKGVAKLFSTLQRYGFTNVDCTIYDECRHELLNELNHDKIMVDISKWIEKVLSNNSPASEQGSDNDSASEKGSEDNSALEQTSEDNSVSEQTSEDNSVSE